MTEDSSRLHDPDSRAHHYGQLQRRAKIGFAIAAVVALLVAIPLLTNPELRLDVARWLGTVPAREGELVATDDSGATLIVLPMLHELEATDLPERRFLAAYLTWPDTAGMRLEPLDGGAPFTVPLETYDHVAAAPDASVMYLAGPGGGVLVDVAANAVVSELGPGEAPDVDWDWETAVWMQRSHLCDRVSPGGAWIACFERPVLPSYLAGDWHLDLQAYGRPVESWEVMRGLGFQPIVGFTADDAWLYIYNERGIRRVEIADVVGG